jgi:hypothetical protein
LHRDFVISCGSGASLGVSNTFGEDSAGVWFGWPKGHPEVIAARAYFVKTKANEVLFKAIALLVKGAQPFLM